MWNDTVVERASFVFLATAAMMLGIILGKQISPWGAALGLIAAWIGSGAFSYYKSFPLKTASLLLIPSMLATAFLLCYDYWPEFQLALASLPTVGAGDKLLGLVQITHAFSFMWLPSFLLVLSLIGILARQTYKLKKRDIFGSASLATFQDYQRMGLYKPDGTLLGKDNFGRLLKTPELYSRLIVAPSGKGKGTSVIIPTLLTENRSIVNIDPKGENWAVSAKQRKLGFNAIREIITLDPFRITKLDEFKKPELVNENEDFFYAINPLDTISEDPLKRSRDIANLVNALVMTNPKEAIPNRWDQYASIILEGLINYVIDTIENPTLLNVHSCLVLSPEDGDILWRSMLEHGGPAQAAASKILQAGHDERGSLLSSTYEQIHWLLEPNLQATISKTNFSFDKLLTGEQDIFIIMPEDQIKIHARYIRLILVSIISFLQKQPPSKKPKKEILFLLDELGQLGYCQPIEEAVTIVRARGAKIWAVFQSRDQIKIYKNPKVFESMDIKQFFGIDDDETLKWINFMGGKKTDSSRSIGKSTQYRASLNSQLGRSNSEQETSTDLLPINVIRELPPDEQLVFITGEKPIRCKKITYWKEKSLQALSDLNPLENNN